MELMVALAISLIIGITIITVLRIGMTSWQRAEQRRTAFDAARLVQQQLTEDFEALAVPSATRQAWQNPLPDNIADSDVYSAPPDQPQCLLISDYAKYPQLNGSLTDAEDVAAPPRYPGGTDPAPGWGRPQRLTLVRRITPEDLAQDPALRLAGNGLDDDGDGRVDEESYNLHDDDGDTLRDEDLASTGGLMSVTYMLQLDYGETEQELARASGLPVIPHYVLRRGIQSPVSGVLAAPPDADGDGEPDWDSWPVLARDVMYFGLSFQTAFHSNSALVDRPGDDAHTRPPYPTVYDDWDTWPPSPAPSPPPTGTPEPYLASPESMWDSSRGLYDPRKFPRILPPAPNSFAFYKEVFQPAASGPASLPSLLTPADDVFPRRVFAVLVLDAGPHLTPRALLGRTLEAWEDPSGSATGLVPVTTSASRGFAEALRSPQGGDLPALRERQHALLVDADSNYEWIHYDSSLHSPPHQRYLLDRRSERSTLRRRFQQGKSLLVSGMTFFFEVELPSYRAADKGFQQ